MSLFRNQFDPNDENKPPIPEEEDAVLEKVAKRIIMWRMAVPAILFLESSRPVNYIGAQMLVFIEPMVQTVFDFKDYDTFRIAMERRENVENLLQKIEKYDAILFEREKAIKKFMKAEKKNWKWYQRFLGVFKPKVQLPEELRAPLFPEMIKEKKGWFRK